MRLLLPLVLAFFAGTAVAAQAATAEAACGPQDGIAEPERLAHTIRWTTASEQDNFGYDVYRGDSEDGPFQKLTTDPILGHGSTSEPHDYSYRDSAIDPCKSYWYYVESISTEGVREVFTPVVHAGPKRQAATADADASKAG